MKRHQSYGLIIASVAFLWLYLKVFGRGESYTEANWIIDVAPWYSLVCFGCYCLTKIGLDLLTFNDYPEEINKLEEDIKIADADLKKRGFVQ